MFGGVQVDSREDQLELGGGDLDAPGVGVDSRDLEAAAFESFVPEDQSVAVPEEDFESIATAIEEEEEVSGEGVLSKGVVDDGGEPVERGIFLIPLAVETAIMSRP